MPNIASILKSEIARVARKELRSELLNLKKSLSTYRSELAALKRRTQSLEAELHRVGKAGPKALPVKTQDPGTGAQRFTAKGLASQRRRLSLSVEDCALLIGASGQSVYNWESGKARPRAKMLPAILALRTLSKKVVAAQLASLSQKR